MFSYGETGIECFLFAAKMSSNGAGSVLAYSRVSSYLFCSKSLRILRKKLRKQPHLMFSLPAAAVDAVASHGRSVPVLLFKNCS